MRMTVVKASILAMAIACGWVSAARADLVARWSFDDPANLGKDSTGNGNDATLHGEVIAVAEGKQGGAIALSPAKKSFLSVPLKPTLNTPSFTVATWVKAPAPTTDWQGLVAARDAGGFILYATNDGCYGFFLGFEGADRPRMSGPSSNNSKAARGIPPGQWTRIVGTFQAEADQPDAKGNYKGIATFYMNGKVIERKMMEYKPNTAQSLRIGSLPGDKALFDGEIDEVAIWNTADAKAAHEGMAVLDSSINMSPEEAQWEASLNVSAQAMKTRPYYREAYRYIADNPNLPNVLIIGDSISEGYTGVVRKKLEGKADVFRIPQNGGPTPRGVEKLVDSSDWLMKKKWDVIHFNFGLHDLVRLTKKDGKETYDSSGTPRISHEEYERNLEKIVTALKATGAKVIFATTTPVPEGGNGRVKGEEIPYNEAAERVMKKNDVAIDDLYGAMLPVHGKYWEKPNNVHYNDAGYAFLGELVVAKIQEALAGK